MAENGEGRRLTWMRDPQAITTWGFAEDVSIHGTDQDGGLVVLGLTWKEARTLAAQLHRASLHAEELDKGYFEACAEDPWTPEAQAQLFSEVLAQEG